MVTYSIYFYQPTPRIFFPSMPLFLRLSRVSLPLAVPAVLDCHPLAVRPCDSTRVLCTCMRACMRSIAVWGCGPVGGRGRKRTERNDGRHDPSLRCRCDAMRCCWDHPSDGSEHDREWWRRIRSLRSTRVPLGRHGTAMPPARADSRSSRWSAVAGATAVPQQRHSSLPPLHPPSLQP